MKKFSKISSWYPFITILGVLLMSCEDTDVSETMLDTNQPVLTVTSSTGSFNFNDVENDQVITITATLSKPTDKQVRVYMFQESGTADAEDIGLPATGYINIPAYQTTASASIIINKDDLLEDTETAIINIGDTRTTAASYTPFQMNIQIENYVSEDLKIIFDWEKDIDIQGNTYSTCGNADIDVYIAHAEGFDINDPFVNIIEDYSAATGNCPEEWTITFENYPDGEYVFFTDFYENQFIGVTEFESIPVKTIFTRAGVFSQTVEQDPSQVFTTYTASGSINGYIAKLIIVDGVYTIQDIMGDTVISGRSSSSQKTKRPKLNR
ncbi:hypothetical protein LX77_03202 [Gelidibacter algens]|uniref:Calx-beta domain-containing protein n=1 Tax=Gelidibacter algens TaxID=49280 RepID=A0A327RV01_9FLAO|nr:hypothetical protein [Gelidibacter algens]RAJ19988.1 hypothetical protein LX77_03202 [Gelidibacter algens]